MRWISTPPGLWMPIMQAWYDDAELLSKWADPETTSHTAGFHDSAVNYTAYSYRLAPESCVVGWAKLDAIIESALVPCGWARRPLRMP